MGSHRGNSTPDNRVSQLYKNNLNYIPMMVGSHWENYKPRDRVSWMFIEPIFRIYDGGFFYRENNNLHGGGRVMPVLLTLGLYL